MIAIGRYFVFMISVVTTMSSPLNNEDANKVLDFLAFFTNILIVHNDFRTQHGVPMLKLDKKLNDDAKDIRDKLINNHSNPIPNDIGCNIGHGVVRDSSDLSKEEATRIVSVWYNTGAEYDYENEPSKEIALSAAPFTQIVWKKTKKIGISLWGKADSTYDLIVTYDPKGNKNRQYHKNVFKPKE